MRAWHILNSQQMLDVLFLLLLLLTIIIVILLLLATATTCPLFLKRRIPVRFWDCAAAQVTEEPWASGSESNTWLTLSCLGTPLP